MMREVVEQILREAHVSASASNVEVTAHTVASEALGRLATEVPRELLAMVDAGRGGHLLTKWRAHLQNARLVGGANAGGPDSDEVVEAAVAFLLLDFVGNVGNRLSKAAGASLGAARYSMGFNDGLLRITARLETLLRDAERAPRTPLQEDEARNMAAISLCRRPRGT